MSAWAGQGSPPDTAATAPKARLALDAHEQPTMGSGGCAPFGEQPPCVLYRRSEHDKRLGNAKEARERALYGVLEALVVREVVFCRRKAYGGFLRPLRGKEGTERETARAKSCR